MNLHCSVSFLLLFCVLKLREARTRVRLRSLLVGARGREMGPAGLYTPSSLTMPAFCDFLTFDIRRSRSVVD